MKNEIIKKTKRRLIERYAKLGLSRLGSYDKKIYGVKNHAKYNILK